MLKVDGLELPKVDDLFLYRTEKFNERCNALREKYIVYSYNSKFGLVDTYGNILLDASYDYIKLFDMYEKGRNEYALICYQHGGKVYGIYDISNKKMIIDNMSVIKIIDSEKNIICEDKTGKINLLNIFTNERINLDYMVTDIQRCICKVAEYKNSGEYYSIFDIKTNTFWLIQSNSDIQLNTPFRDIRFVHNNILFCQTGDNSGYLIFLTKQNNQTDKFAERPTFYPPTMAYLSSEEPPYWGIGLPDSEYNY